MSGRELAAKVIAGERRALAKAITLIETKRLDQRQDADELLETIMPHSGGSLRLGISGPPGVGKSTFIEAFGMRLVNAGRKVSVLAVDPSSPLTGGSILGDKTRMTELANHPSAFIRPSSTGSSLGGVARRTRETILACEAAGYDVVIVETVGVGQSEHVVASMVDVFIMLQLPNAGDELQGIKKGILELADVICITKADGHFLAAARLAKADHESALQLVKAREAWQPQVLLLSSIEGLGIAELESRVEAFALHQKQTGAFSSRRVAQASSWFEAEFGELLRERIESDECWRAQLAHHRAEVKSQNVPPSVAARRLIARIFS